MCLYKAVKELSIPKVLGFKKKILRMVGKCQLCLWAVLMLI